MGRMNKDEWSEGGWCALGGGWGEELQRPGVCAVLKLQEQEMGQGRGCGELVGHEVEEEGGALYTLLMNVISRPPKLECHLKV